MKRKKQMLLERRLYIFHCVENTKVFVIATVINFEIFIDKYIQGETESLIAIINGSILKPIAMKF